MCESDLEYLLLCHAVTFYVFHSWVTLIKAWILANQPYDCPTDQPTDQ